MARRLNCHKELNYWIALHHNHTATTRWSCAGVERLAAASPVRPQAAGGRAAPQASQGSEASMLSVTAWPAVQVYTVGMWPPSMLPPPCSPFIRIMDMKYRRMNVFFCCYLFWLFLFLI